MAAIPPSGDGAGGACCDLRWRGSGSANRGSRGQRPQNARSATSCAPLTGSVWVASLEIRSPERGERVVVRTGKFRMWAQTTRQSRLFGYGPTAITCSTMPGASSSTRPTKARGSSHPRCLRARLVQGLGLNWSGHRLRSNPSLPCTSRGNRSQRRQRFSVDSQGFRPDRFATGCHRLQPRGSIKAPSFVVCLDYGRFGGVPRNCWQLPDR